MDYVKHRTLKNGYPVLTGNNQWITPHDALHSGEKVNLYTIPGRNEDHVVGISYERAGYKVTFSIDIKPADMRNVLVSEEREFPKENLIGGYQGQ
jgi:hypothetical protein